MQQSKESPYNSRAEERKEGEESPLVIILCAEKDHEQIELLQLQDSGIHVAQYLTKPIEKVLKQDLQKAIEKARAIAEGSEKINDANF